MKYFWYRCKEKATGTDQEVCVLARSFAKAEQRICENPKYIPLEYLGWTPVTNEEKTGERVLRKEYKQLTIYDFIKEEK